MHQTCEFKTYFSAFFYFFKHYFLNYIKQKLGPKRNSETPFAYEIKSDIHVNKIRRECNFQTFSSVTFNIINSLKYH